MLEPHSPRSRANVSATLRGCVALYLVWLGVQLIRGAGAPDTTMPVWLNWVFGILLILAALGFGWYTLRRWLSDKAAAKIQEEENE